MRAQIVAGLLAAVAVVTGCGDDGKQMTEPDAAPDSPTGPQCNDGLDNDGDGLKDYPSDPGCVAPQQDDEVDDCPSGANCPQCGNKVDDDGNGSIDYPNDPGCTSAADPFEFANNPVACGAGLTIKQLPSNGLDSGMLATSSSTSMLTSTCGGGGGAPAIAYQISLTDPKVVVANTVGSTANTVLDLRPSNCTQASLACNDDISASISASSLTKSLPAGNYYLIVSGADSATSGDYSLEVKLYTGEGETCTSTQQCGPGLVCRTPLGGTGMKCSKPQCSDTVDDDGDGKNDYPTDPGCTGPDDNDETDTCPTGPGCPACSNGLDDDNDTRTDYPADTSCTAASGNSEACTGEEDPLVAVTSGTTMGTLVGAHDNHNPTCSSGENGGDILFTLTIPALRSMVIDTEGSTADTILSLLSAACTEPSIGCDDDGGTSTFSSRLAFTNLAAGTYIVAVDNYSSTKPPGPFNLHITGVIQPGGRCGSADSLGGALACPASNPCGAGPGGTMICLPSACGDGMDNDGDGKMDYPADPGCSALDDIDETDSCPGAGCPECADGIDNDNDGAIDYPMDTTCASASSSEGCVSTESVVPLVMPVTMDTTVGATNDVRPACASTTHTAPDKTYSVQIPAMRSLSIVKTTVTGTFDAVVALYNSSCGGTAVQCNNTPETVSLTNVPGGQYFFVVDGFSTASGDYTLTVSGTIQNGASCELVLAHNGAITCGTGFTCAGTSGARTCRPAACNDGIDNDGDGVADFPNDAGCTSTSDNDEADTCPGTGCPTCSDGLDNDGDLLIDFPDDPSCASASANSEACFTTEGVTPIVAPMTADTTVGATNDEAPACTTSINTAPDKVYSLIIPTVTSLSITNTNAFDAVVSLYDATCGGTPVSCSNDPEDLTIGPLAAGTYYYAVDGNGSAPGAPYTIGISGRIAPLQSCESTLAVSGALTCSNGYACKGTMGSRTCQTAACNDGVDNDSDSKRDFPSDPGCTSLSDDDETDACPSGAGCPVCSNGMDDDADGAIDYPMDPGCAYASSNDEQPCLATEGVTTLTMPNTMDTTVGATDDRHPACASTTNTAPDKTYALDLPATSSLTITNTNAFDAVVELVDATCGANPALVCNDEPETLQAGPLSAGRYYYLVDGYGTGTGAYTLNVRGTIMDGGSCESSLAQSGALTCGPGHACKGTTGLRTCEIAQCGDGMNNDGDAFTDYPLDPGCTSSSDDDETDPATAGVCSNGMDDDTDTTMDYPADYGCSSAAGASEAFCMVEADPTSLITSTPVIGTTTGKASNFASASCQSNTAGPDVVYALQLPVPVATLVLDLSNSTISDTVLTFRNAQCSAEIGCDDDSGDPGNQSKLTLTNVDAGGYAVVVDGYSTNAGAFTLSVKGTVATGRTCTSPLFASGVLACPAGTTCSGTPATCH